ncbi:hypothetical protein CMO89_04280 [Candidatus Woesearchaeota archaeon]|nr:hypothetical protein [Candidatus Woesearchaeota archaeon]
MASKILSLVKSFFSKTPSYVIFFITAKCNSRCRMCFYWKNIEKHQEQKELTIDEIKKISRNLNNIQYLSVSGGEPTLRDDMPEIVKTFVKNNKVKFVSVPTNALQPERIAGLSEDMFRSCPGTSFRIALSIDGIGKEHDDIRGVKGNFEKVGETYRLLDRLRSKYRNFNIDVTTVYSSFNKDKIKDIFNWVEQNMKIDNHVLLLTRGNPREGIAKDVTIEGYEKAAKFVEKRTFKKRGRRKDIRLTLLRAAKLVMRDVISKTLKQKRMVLPCVAGDKFVILNETGKVYPCELLSMEMGDLRQENYDIKRILFSAKGRKVKKFIKDTKCFCTFECAIQNNIIYNPLAYPAVLKKLVFLR